MILKKSKGQHLLTDKNMINRIAEESKISSGDNIIEIGPGTGLLTEALCRRAARVVAFEVDKDFKEALENLQGKYQNLEVIMADFLKYDLNDFLCREGGKWRVNANIPYNITSPIIEKIIEEGREHITDFHLLMQKEVARRITAPPGNKDYGRLSVFVSFFCESKILFTVPPDVFVPPPKVDSALIRMKFKEELPDLNANLYFKLVGAAFAQRRKQIKNALKDAVENISPEEITLAFQRAGIDPSRRGETLSIQEFATLTKSIRS